jgi:hypothetical protein
MQLGSDLGYRSEYWRFTDVTLTNGLDLNDPM